MAAELELIRRVVTTFTSHDNFAARTVTETTVVEEYEKPSTTTTQKENENG